MDAADIGTSLVGTWRLLSVSFYDPDGGCADSPLGANPTGTLIYTSDGHVAALISHAGRRPLSVDDRLTAVPEEQADAFATFFSYAGRYAVEGAKVRHQVDVASVENWVGEEFIRKARLDGETLTLRTPPMPLGGVRRVAELIWERAVTAQG